VVVVVLVVLVLVMVVLLVVLVHYSDVGDGRRRRPPRVAASVATRRRHDRHISLSLHITPTNHCSAASCPRPSRAPLIDRPLESAAGNQHLTHINPFNGPFPGLHG